MNISKKTFKAQLHSSPWYTLEISMISKRTSHALPDVESPWLCISGPFKGTQSLQLDCRDFPNTQNLPGRIKTHWGWAVGRGFSLEKIGKYINLFCYKQFLELLINLFFLVVRWCLFGGFEWLVSMDKICKSIIWYNLEIWLQVFAWKSQGLKQTNGVAKLTKNKKLNFIPFCKC